MRRLFRLEHHLGPSTCELWYRQDVAHSIHSSATKHVNSTMKSLWDDWKKNMVSGIYDTRSFAEPQAEPNLYVQINKWDIIVFYLAGFE